jgi:hypothetical protein
MVGGRGDVVGGRWEFPCLPPTTYLLFVSQSSALLPQHCSQHTRLKGNFRVNMNDCDFFENHERARDYPLN